MKEYKVLITETYQKTVVVEAETAEEAHRRASDAWKNTECILDSSNFQGAEFHVVGEADGDVGEKRAERIEPKGGEPVE